MLIAGLGVGGGAAFGVGQLLPAPDAGPAKPKSPVEEEANLAFIKTEVVLVPLVFPDGRLAGYTSIDAALQVPADQAEALKARMPLLLHAINLQTFRTPLAAGPDGQLADLEGYRKIVAAAAPKAFGAGVVRKVAIIQANPS
jgi:hypothetical protein